MRLLRGTSLVAICALVVSSESNAEGQRSFVASYGIYTGTCTRTIPCRRFDDAIAQTDPGGEVIVLDSAGYGTATITKSIALIAPPGVYAGITVFSGGDGITISAANTDDVILRGLTINGQGGTNGIFITSARSVSVENVVVSGMTLSGIDFHPLSDAVVLAVTASTFRNNGIGITAYSNPGNAALSRLAVQRTEFLGNVTGLEIINIDRVSVVDSAIAGRLPLASWCIYFSATVDAAGNTSIAIERTTITGYLNGVTAVGSGGKLAVVNIAHSVVAGNSIGVGAGDGGYVRLMANQIDGNGTGTYTSGTGVIASLGDNLRYGNSTEGVAATPLTPY